MALRRALFLLAVLVVASASGLAYLSLLPPLFTHTPGFDKAMHFLGYGTIALTLDLVLEGRPLSRGASRVPLALPLVALLATVEEGLQSLSPVRSCSAWDLAANLLGIVLLGSCGAPLRGLLQRRAEAQAALTSAP